MVFTVNGKEYKSKPVDFNIVCDLEEKGISLKEVNRKPMSAVRAYFALCTGKGNEYSGKELEQHVVKGGTFDEVIAAMNEELEKSEFFQALRKTAETEDAADQEEAE